MIYQNYKFHERRGRGSCASVWPYKSYTNYYSENESFLRAK